MHGSAHTPIPAQSELFFKKFTTLSLNVSLRLATNFTVGRIAVIRPQIESTPAHSRPVGYLSSENGAFVYRNWTLSRKFPSGHLFRGKNGTSAVPKA